MLKRNLISFLLFISTGSLFSQTSDLLISEYGEGSSGTSKYIEIYNGTGANVSLTNYRLCMVANGGTWCESNYTFSTANLANGATLVIANNSGDVPGADEYSTSISWNGDDAVSLQKFSGTWNLLDVVGTDGADPGTGWDVAGTTNATKDHTLTRKTSVCDPNTNWTSSRGTTVANSEWTITTYTTGSANSGHSATCVACTPDSEPTTNASTLSFSNIGCSSIDLSWTSGNGTNRIVVASSSPITGSPTDQINYNSNTNFGTGDIISAGEFVVYNNTGNSFTVTGLSTSTTYYFSIFEYNGTNPNCTENYLTSSPESNSETTTTCTNPEITGILVDACGGTEGTDEFFTFTNGNSSLSLNDLKADFPNGESYCNPSCASKTWVTNATYVAQLNTTAGCGGLFLEVDPIPAGAKTIVFTGSSPSYNFDFTGLCGTGPYYAIFANNTSSGGRFGNYNSDCSQFRTLTVHFGGGYSDNVTYQRCSLSNTDGDYVSFDSSGNPTYKNDGCTPTAILPVSLLSFSGKSNNSNNAIYWSTISEINNDYFTLEKSNNGVLFSLVTNIKGAGNSNSTHNYTYTDNNPYIGVNYYRLKQTDFNGDFSYSNIIALDANTINYNIWHYSNNLTIDTKANINAQLSIYNTVGNLVYTQNIDRITEINTSKFKKGIYLVKIVYDSKVLVKKFKF